MIIKASGRSALILATGLWVCFAGPSQATGDVAATGSTSASPSAPIVLGKYAKHASRHLKKVAHRKSGKLAEKSSSDGKTATSDTAENKTPGDSDASPPAASSALSASVANANARMASADTPDSNARAMTARASTILQNTSDKSPDAQDSADDQPANMQVVSADQLNDVDRALHEKGQNSQRQATLAMASAEPPAKAVSNDSNSWDETSLIGKIFIGFGAILTMASAARMFMA